jgi:hypothetical protein
MASFSLPVRLLVQKTRIGGQILSERPTIVEDVRETLKSQYLAPLS